MQMLVKRLTGLALKRPGFALGLWGEPGVGKSHLAQRTLEQVAYRSVAVPATVALSGLVRALPLPEALPSWLERGLKRLGRGEIGETQQLVDLLGGLLAEMAPLVLHLEDLHEAPPTRLELWNALALQTRRTTGIALLATSRIQPPEGFEAVRVEALDAQASTDLLAGELGTPPPEAASQWIFAKAGGNPLFTLEYLRHLTRQGFLWNDGRRWYWREPTVSSMPVTVEALLEQTLEQALEEPLHTSVIEARAMLNSPDPQLWAAMAGCEPAALEQACLVFEQHGLLRQGEFAHPLYREVVTGRILPIQQQTLARRALAALGDPVARVEFIEQAGMTAEATLEALEQGVAAIEAQGREVEAAQLKARAVVYATGQKRTRLAFSAAQVLHKVNLLEATRLAEAALEDPNAPAEAVYLMAELLASKGRMEEVEAALRRLPEGQRGGPEWPRRLLCLKAQVRDFSGVLELWQAQPKLRQKPDPEVLCHVGWGLIISGKLDEVPTLLEPLDRTKLKPEWQAEVQQLRGAWRFYRGEFVAAEGLFQRAVGGFREAGAAQKMVTALKNRANVLRLLGGHREAKTDLEEALELCAQRGDLDAYAQVQITLAQMLVGLGEYESAEGILHQALQALARADLSHIAHHGENVLCELYQTWRPPLGKVLALKHAESALELARKLGHPRFIAQGLALLGQAETARGNPWLGLELCQEALELARQLNEPERICIIQSYQAEAQETLGRKSEAQQNYQQAFQLAQQSGLLFEAQRIGLRLDYLEQKPSRAKARLDWFAKHGLQSGVEQVRRLFPMLDDHPPQPTPTQLPRLEVLGPMNLRADGSVQGVRGQKRKELLALLLEARMAGRSELGKLELLDSLYPESDETLASASLKTSIRQIRSTYGQTVLQTTANGYALGLIESDAEVFLQQGEVGLWRGPYLEDAESRDENVREGLYQALRRSLEGLLETNPSEAIRLSRILLEAEPYDLDFLALNLRALRAANNHRSLARTYQTAKERMLEVGETLPEQWADFLNPALSR